MRRLIYTEFKKITANHFLLILICISSLLQCCFSIYSLHNTGERYFNEMDLTAVYDEIRGLSVAEQKEILEADSEKIKNELLYNFDETSYVHQYGQIMSRNHVMEHIQKCETYSDYLEEISVQTEEIKGSSLLSADNSFSIRNAQNIADIYSVLPRISLSAASSSGVVLLTQNPITDILLLLCISVIVISITTSEKAEGYHLLFQSKPKGGFQLYGAKIIILCVSVFFLCLFFYGINFLFLKWKIGFCDMTLPIQSLEPFYQCPFSLTVMEFFLYYFAAKLIVLFIISFVFFAIGTVSSSYIFAYTVGGIIFLAALILQKAADYNSAASVISEISLISILDIAHYFIKAQNINLLNNPVSIIIIGILSAILYLIISVLVSRFFWFHMIRENFSVTYFQRILMHKSTKASVSKHKSLIYFELKKLFILERTWIFLIVFVSLMIYLHLPSKFVTSEEYYYNTYSQIFAGALSDEKQDYLNEEDNRIKTSSDRIEYYNQLYNNGEISDVEYSYYFNKERVPAEQEYAFQRVKTQYQKLSDLKAQGEQVLYLNETGWDQIFNDKNRRSQAGDYLICILFLILCLSNFSCMEHTSRVRILAECTPYGSKHVFRIKAGLSAGLGGAAALFSFLLYLISTHVSRSLEGWSSTQIVSGSITCAPELFSSLPVLYFLIVLSIICIICGMSAALIILGFSRVMKRQVSAIVSSYILLGLPAALFWIGII